MAPPEFGVKLVLEAAISPTEDPQKVAAAVGRVVGYRADAVSVGAVAARLSIEDPRGLLPVRDQLRDRRIRSAARRQLLVNKEGRSTSMMLNRQAATAGIIAICGSPQESPLGPIYFTLTSEKLDAAIDWLTAYESG